MADAAVLLIFALANLGLGVRACLNKDRISAVLHLALGAILAALGVTDLL